MKIPRHEIDVITGESRTIDQVLYANNEGDILLADFGEDPPDGFFEIDEIPERT